MSRSGLLSPDWSGLGPRDAPPARPRSRRGPLGRGIALLITAAFSALLAFGGAEAALRLAGPNWTGALLPLSYDVQAIDRIAVGDAYVTFDADLGWVTTPGADRWGGGVHYRHNADGLRADHAYARSPEAGVRRIVAYGDSYTYCQEVDFAECWTTRLEQLLPGSEVLNFGVPAYGPDQAWLRYGRDGASWRPCVVLIGHMLENVNRVVNRFRPFYEPNTGIPLAKPRYIVEGGRPVLLPSPARRSDALKDPAWVEANLGPGDAWYFQRTFAAGPLDRLELFSLARTARYRRERGALDAELARYAPDSESLEVLTAVLIGFADQVRADGATPVVLVFPMKSQIKARRDGVPEQHAALLAALEAHGVLTIDLTDALARQAGRSDLDDLAEGHFRPRGNAVVARTLAASLPAVTNATCGTEDVASRTSPLARASS